MKTLRFTISATVLAIVILLTSSFDLGSLSNQNVATALGKSKVRFETLMDIKRQAGSSFAWIMAEGYDPRLGRRPGWGSITRTAWEELGPSVTGHGSTLQQAGAAALVPFRDAAPAFSRNILVTRDFSQTPYQTEPHLAVNPNDPDHLLVGVIDYGSPSIGTYVSFDGGQTWAGPHQVPYLRDDVAAAGDPVVGFDQNGNAYAIYISVGVEDFAVGPFVFETQISSIGLGSSQDGGVTWKNPVSTAKASVSTKLSLDQFGRSRGSVEVSFLDKPWLAIGPHPEEPSKDVIYLTYTDFTSVVDILYIGDVPTFGLTEVLTTIKLVTSTDGGKTWTEPINVSPTVRRSSSDVPTAGEAMAEGLKRIVQGSYPIVSSDGTLYVTWMDSTDDDSQKGDGEIYIARSTNAGATFTTPIRASAFREPGFRPKTAFFRYWGGAFPRAAVGPQDEVYIVYMGLSTTKPTDDGDIFIVRSMDKGETWSAPRRLGGDETDRLQFFPSIAADPSGGLHVSWGDMRDDPSGLRYHIYYTQSEDGGETWGFKHAQSTILTPDTRMTDFPSNSNQAFPYGLFIGDYFAIAATDDEVYAVWADARLGEFGSPNQKIAFARKKAMTSSEIYLSPASGPGGQQVTIQGFNFQPDLNIFINVGGIMVATDRTNKEGRFTNQLFMPVSGEGAQEVLVFDESGNAAATSFFTEFGFGNVRDKQIDLETAIGTLVSKVETLAGGSPTLPADTPQDSRSSDRTLIIFALIIGGIGLIVSSGAVLFTAYQFKRSRP